MTTTKTIINGKMHRIVSIQTVADMAEKTPLAAANFAKNGWTAIATVIRDTPRSKVERIALIDEINGHAKFL